MGEERSGEYAYCTSYSYDPVGNRLVKVDGGLLTTYIYNIADELLTVTLPTGEVTTSTWDANGNLQSEEAEAGQTAYAWDDENRLLRITSPGGSIDTFTYAADSLRRRKEPGSTARNFVWDGLNVLQELDATFLTAAQYTDMAGEWGGLVSMRRGDVSSFFSFDLQSSSRLLTSPAGTVTDEYLYKAFGEELMVSGGTANPLRFVGRFGYYREAAEPTYVRTRYLNVTQGRWLSRDPIGFQGGANVYGYVAADPVGCVDPAGLCHITTKYEDPSAARRRRRIADVLQGLLQAVDYALMAADLPSGLRFTQPSVGRYFRHGELEGLEVEAVARELQLGTRPSSTVPIRVIRHEGNTFIMDNRSATAWAHAEGRLPSDIRDITGVDRDEYRKLMNRLREHGVLDEGAVPRIRPGSKPPCPKKK